MKKIILCLCLFLSLSAFAVEDVVSETVKFDYNSEKFEFFSVSKEAFTDVDDYKKYKKILKLYKKNKFEKILKFDSSNVPALYALYKDANSKENYELALQYLNQIKTDTSYFESDYINRLILIQKYNLKQYKFVISDFKMLKGDLSELYAKVADSYLHIGDINNSLKYANKVMQTNEDYYFAQEIIFRCYYRKKDFVNAKKIAKKLISLKPENTGNYIRAAYVEKNNSLKLDYLYQARKFADSHSFYFVNSLIMDLEQKKLDNYYKSQSKYVDRLNWKEIIMDSANYGTDLYWIRRQDDFFKDCNVCILDYQGDETAKCFKSVKENQNKLSEQINFRLEHTTNKKFQKKIVSQNAQRIRQQNQIIRQNREQLINQSYQNTLLHDIAH